MKTETSTNLSPYKVVIVDNDEMCIDELIFGINSNDPGKEFRIVGTAKTGKSAEKIIIKQKPDLLFLDIELPDTNGIDLLEKIRDKVDWEMFTVFFTAHSRYALEAIRLSAFDYLLKPIDKKELGIILDRFKKQYIQNITKAESTKTYERAQKRYLRFQNEKKLNRIKKVEEHLKEQPEPIQPFPISYRNERELNPIMGVEDIAEELAEIIQKIPCGQGGMIGIFGQWGRGKTFLMNETWKHLTSQNNSTYRVDFQAWRYQETPAI